MDKPFIIRLFGSLFSMEGNTFSKMKERLPKIMEDAMPNILTDFTEADPPSKTACEGMRLFNALEYLHQGGVAIGSIAWTFDDTVDESGLYLMLPGQILGVREGEQGAAHLLIQVVHQYVDEDGLGGDATTRATNINILRSEVIEQQDDELFLGNWLQLESSENRNKALREGFLFFFFLLRFTFFRVFIKITESHFLFSWLKESNLECVGFC